MANANTPKITTKMHITTSGLIAAPLSLFISSVATLAIALSAEMSASDPSASGAFEIVVTTASWPPSAAALPVLSSASAAAASLLLFRSLISDAGEEAVDLCGAIVVVGEGGWTTLASVVTGTDITLVTLGDVTLMVAVMAGVVGAAVASGLVAGVHSAWDGAGHPHDPSTWQNSDTPSSPYDPSSVLCLHSLPHARSTHECVASTFTPFGYEVML